MTKEFWKAALIRCIRTIAQTAIASIGTTAMIQDVNWMVVLSTSALAGLLSILTSIVTGLPEAETKPEAEKKEPDPKPEPAPTYEEIRDEFKN